MLLWWVICVVILLVFCRVGMVFGWVNDESLILFMLVFERVLIILIFLLVGMNLLRCWNLL